MNKAVNKIRLLTKVVITTGITIILLLLHTQYINAAQDDKTQYIIKVNRVHNTVTIYEKDEKEQLEKPIKAMACSVGTKGTPTRLGTFKTKEKYRWKLLMGDVWGQYSTRIVGGILFHSVYYTGGKNPATLAVNQYNKLGKAASHGCIRLTVQDAKWIYDNCSIGTTVVVYDDKDSPGPLGKPETIKLPDNVRWDPTDPNNENPYKDLLPKISGVKDFKVSLGMDIDILEGVRAKSSVGTDITKDIKIDGTIDIDKIGIYQITYTVTDALDRTSYKVVDITVEGLCGKPELVGVHDRVIGGNTKVTSRLALAGVSAYCGGREIDKNNIKYSVKRINSKEYLITYILKSSNGLTATDYAHFYIDKDAPEFAGISDRILKPGQIPDRSFALDGVTVSDNYFVVFKSDIKVSIEEHPYNTKKSYDYDNGSDETVISDGVSGNSHEKINDICYLVTYELEDQLGNKAETTVIFHY